MSWYVIDAVDRAIERTRTCLIEPFDLWKWVKLAIIAFFIGGSGGGGFNSGGNNYGGSDSDFSSLPSGINEIGNSIQSTLSSFSVSAIIIGAILLIVLFVLLMSIIGSIMDFVFVESLVYNDVHIRGYFKKYLGKGLSLFILRILIGLGIMLIMAIMALISLSLMGVSFSDMSNLESADSNGMLMLLPFMIFIFIAVVLVVAIITGILGSFINMSIPVSMYSDCSIFSGLSRVLGQFRKDWKQIIIYWIGRLILGIAVGIAMAIVGFILAAILLILLGIVDLVLYFVFSAILSDTAVWVLLIPILVVELILFILIMAFIGMPAKVFMKYHMLTFLQKWYPIDLPMFDNVHRIADSNMGEWVNEGTIPEQ
jgi:hypothetical protein